MKAYDISENNTADLVLRGSPNLAEVQQVFAEDRISALLNQASTTILIVTNILINQLIRLAELMDVPALCLPNSAIPDGVFLQTAQLSGIWLSLSPIRIYEPRGCSSV